MIFTTGHIRWFLIGIDVTHMVDCKLEGRRQPSVLGTSFQLSSTSWALQSHWVGGTQGLMVTDFTIVNVSHWWG